MEMIEEYGYLGSAPHMAFTSILIGVIALVKMLKLSRIYRRSKGGLLN